MDFTNLIKYVGAVVGAFLLSEICTKYILRRCRELKIVDEPGERRLHSAPVPRLGGIAVFAAFQVVSLLLLSLYSYLSKGGGLDPVWWFQFLLPASVLFIVGVLDDLFQLTPLVKLFGQVVAATLLIYFGTSIGNIAYFELHPAVDYLLTLFWFLLVINAFNLIDGLDGLAGGLAAIAATGLLGIFLLSGDVFSALVVLAFIGAVAGFLRHNLHPAEIFLGDSGSMFIGFTLAAFTLRSPSTGSTVATLGACVLALGVPLLDTMLAVWRRSVRSLFSSGSGVMSADMDHLHHRLVKRGITQKNVALSLYALSAGLVAVGLLSLLFSSYALGIYLIAFTFGTYIILRHLAHVELWDSGTVIARGISRPSMSIITTTLYPVADALVMTLALAVACHLGTPLDTWGDFRALFVGVFPVWVGTCFVAVGLAGTYRRVWSRARVSEFVYLVGAFALGTIAAAGMTKFFGARENIPDLVLFTTLYFGIGGGLLTALRSIPRVVNDLLVLNSAGKGPDGGQQRQILVVGADILYLRNLKDIDWEASNAIPFKVVGLVDGDRNLRKRIVHGYRVLGTPDELPQLLTQYEVDEIVITAEADEVDRGELVRLGEKTGILVKEWGVRENVLTKQTAAGLRAQIERSSNQVERANGVTETTVVVSDEAVGAGSERVIVRD
ncbi:MAG: hypothetical protein KDD70_02165 [Bdellovibrionales bacterium]|nr:hypothetical protein [Bdellovibrionales bacterium]